MLAGASQATVRVLPSGVIRLTIGTSGVVLGVPENVEDQGPSPALVTARSSRSYRTPLVSPVMVCSRLPRVQTSCSSVHVAPGLFSSAGI